MALIAGRLPERTAVSRGLSDARSCQRIEYIERFVRCQVWTASGLHTASLHHLLTCASLRVSSRGKCFAITSVFRTSGSSTSSASSTETEPRRINAVIKELAAAGASSFFFTTSSRVLLGALFGMMCENFWREASISHPIESSSSSRLLSKFAPTSHNLARGGGSRGTGLRSFDRRAIYRGLDLA